MNIFKASLNGSLIDLGGGGGGALSKDTLKGLAVLLKHWSGDCEVALPMKTRALPILLVMQRRFVGDHATTSTKALPNIRLQQLEHAETMGRKAHHS